MKSHFKTICIYERKYWQNWSRNDLWIIFFKTKLWFYMKLIYREKSKVTNNYCIYLPTKKIINQF